MENLRDFTESEAELSALNTEDNGSQNAKSSTLPHFWETNTGYEYPPIAEEKNTTNLVGDQNLTPENSDKSLRFEPTEYKNAPLEPKNLVFSKEPAAKTRQEIPPQASYLTFEPTEYKDAPLEQKKLDFSCFDKPVEDKNQEIPPALMPFFELADMLEKEKQPFNTEKTALSIEKAADKTDGNPYAEYLGKGGTIYVHVFDVDAPYIGSGINDQNGKELRPTKETYLAAAEITNKKFYDLDINLKMKITFAKKGESPMTKENFQKRKDYSPTDSYVVVGNAGNLINWQDKERVKYKEVDKIDGHKAMSENNWGYIGLSPDKSLGSSYAEKGIGTQFYALLCTNAFEQFGGTFGYNQVVGSLDANGKPISAEAALAMAISIAIEHEVGHPKFDLHLDDDSPMNKNTNRFADWGLGGHKTGTIMSSYPSYNAQYDDYMISVLRHLHGSCPDKKNIRINDWMQLGKSWLIDWENMNWAERAKYAKNKAISFAKDSYDYNYIESDLNFIFSNRTDLPKSK
jgi:hypothetical protein